MLCNNKEDREAENTHPNRKRNLIIVISLALIALVVTLSVVLTLPKKEQEPETTSTSDADTVDESLKSTLVYKIISPEQEDPTLLIDSATPQGKAFKEVVSMGSTVAFDLRQHFALLTLYFSTGGQNWTSGDGWNTNGDEVCDWYGVDACQDTGSGKQSVTEINLDSNNLEGSVPAEICMLDDLTVLTVTGNNLAASMPACLMNFEGLEFNVRRNLR